MGGSMCSSSPFNFQFSDSGRERILIHGSYFWEENPSKLIDQWFLQSYFQISTKYQITCNLASYMRPLHFVSGNLTDPQFGCRGVCRSHYKWYRGIKGQVVWFFPVSVLEIVILIMHFNTQSVDRRQMGKHGPHGRPGCGWISLYYPTYRLSLLGHCQVTWNKIYFFGVVELCLCSERDQFPSIFPRISPRI